MIMRYRIFGQPLHQISMEQITPVANRKEKCLPPPSKTVAGDAIRPREDFVLSVVVPCFDEEDVILLTYRRLVEVLGSRDFHLQIIFVDDGSDDGTPDMAANLARSDPRVKTVLLSR